MIALLLLTFITLSFSSAPPAETRIPVYRYWSGAVGDHFYTRTATELGLESTGVYNYEGIGFYLSEEGCENALPLYRWYRGSPAYDHFYSTTAAEIGTVEYGVEGNYGYTSEGILGYCYPEAFKRDDMVPLYRYWKSSISDHFYTTSLSEIGAGLSIGEYGNYNYKYEGVQCYVFASASDTLAKELNEAPVDETKRVKDMAQLFTENEQMPFTPVQNSTYQWNYAIIGGVIAMVMAIIAMVCNWYRNKNKKEAGYQMLV